MDVVNESCRAEEGVARADGGEECANLSLDIMLDAVHLGLEMTHEVLVNGLLGDVNQLTFLLCDYPFAILPGALDGGFCHFHGIARGVHAEHAIVEDDVSLGMVVTEEDNIEV